MSAEKVISTEINNLTSLENLSEKNKVFSGRVDINVLLNRARKEKEKKTQTNLLFLGLSISLILIVGIILSF